MVIILSMYDICFMIRFVVQYALQCPIMNSIYYHDICSYIMRMLLFSLIPHHSILSNISCMAVNSLTESGQQVSATKEGS